MLSKTRASLGLAALVAPSAAVAQTQSTAVVSLSGHFFISVLAGVVIALAIQFLLSNLAVALGITATGDLRDAEFSSSSSDNSSSKVGAAGTKVTSGLGIFNTLTMSISLFAGTWLALDLAHATTFLNGAITGLVVWALFFIVCLYIDVKLATSITGRLFEFLRSGLVSTGGAVSSLFSSDKQADPKDFARETIKTLHQEIREEFDLSDIDKKIKEYLNQASSDFSAKSLRKELESLLHELEVDEKFVTDDSDQTKKLIVEVANKQPNMSKEDKQKVSDTLDDIKAAAREGNTHKERATAAVDKLTPGDEEQGKQYRQAVSDYLDNLGQSEVSSEELENDLERIFSNPSSSKDVVSQRLRRLDRNTIKAVISSHKDMDEKKADSVLAAFDKVADKLSNGSQSDAGNEQGTGTSNLPVKRAEAENAVQRWFDRMQRPELSYRDLKADFMTILDNPKTAPEVLSRRLDRMDEQTVRALLTNNNQLSNDDIDTYMAKFNEAKADLKKNLDTFQEEAKRRMDDLHKRALAESEAVRRTAASAAWWLFISALVSGVSAAVAGALASNLL
ncbi:hypothetical protein OCL06_15675 [Alteromonas sp. ASW11-19]|uniref:Uncharacterized protein n=1 Tax=Alteromonas salexigens TaxID=2982530 RepID=A0ABT2VRT5_9ALTE|nr:hypothetical protein [Alteromonas salexigens]MCU7556030.1 hypothetical protein [Alteromonas salexigens]